MTLIAAFSVEGFPILFGDLLVTGLTDANRKVAVPSQGEVQDFFAASGWSVSGLSQKVNLIGDNCAIAWAGSWIGARVAIAALRKRSIGCDLTYERAMEYLNAEPDIKTHPVSFVGLLYEGGLLHQFQFNSDEFLSPSLGLVYVSGSGVPAIHEFSRLLDNAETRSAGSPNAAAQAISRALSLGGLLLQSEFRGGDAAYTLRNMFGGGYEIAFCSDGRLQKLRELTYVVWEAALLSDGIQLSYPQMLIKQSYVEDYLLIRSARVDSQGLNKTARIIDEQRHVIAPMFDAGAKIPLSELEDISLQSRLLCHCILVHDASRIVGIYTRVQQYSPSSEVTITFEDKDGQLVFGLRQDAMLEFAQSLERFRARPPEGIRT